METRLNRLAGSEPCIRIRDELSLKRRTESPERHSQPADTSTEHTSTLTCNNHIIEESPSGESQDNEELLKQTLLVYSTLQSSEDTAQASLGGPSEHQTMFSTMRVVPLDMEKLKEDLSYYQYKLYQRFSIKLTDLVRLETLGKGAFGEVTRVFNKTDRQFYALKEIRRRSFKKPIYFESAVWIEIQNLLKVTELKDPSLLKTALIDFDENEEICYLLMELGGGTLEEYADCMRHYGLTWSENELEYILYQLVSQVLKLKRINMYHRDIKPSNIIISPKEESFKLGDLGCALITTEGVQKLDIAGTPHYMSPELVRAILKQEPVVEHDPYLSDLFSLGVTMLMLLNPDLKRKDIVNFMESTVKEKYPNLYSILRDLLGRPEKRIEGVEKVLATRLSILNYKAFEEGNLGEKYKLYLYLKIISKNKNINTSFYFDMFILDDALLVINKKLDLLTKDMKQEDQNLEEVIWRIKRAQCYYMQMNYEDALKELLEVIQRKELKSFETQNVLTKAKALLWLGIVKLKLGRVEDAIDNLMHCLGIRVAEFGEVHESVSAVFWQLGTIKNLQENFPGATKAFLKSVEIGEKLDPKERKYMAKSLNNLGVMAEFRGDHQKALELFERAKETAIVAYGENHPVVADQYLAISYVYIILGRKQEGLDLYDKALGIKRRWYGENNPEVAEAYTHIARGYDRLGEYRKVLELLSKSVTIWKNVDGEDSQELADVYQLIGNILCKKGQYLKSLAYANKVIYIKEKWLGVGSPWLAATYLWHAETCSGLCLESEKQKSLQKFLAIDFDKLELNIDNIKLGFRAVRLLAEEKKIEKSWEYVQKGYQMCVNLAITKNAKTYACYCEAVGRLRKAEGKYDMALESIKEAINIREHLASKDPDMMAGLYSVMGDLYEALDNDEEALEWRKKCLNMIEIYLSKGSVLMLKALVDIYRVLQKLGMDVEAQERLHEAKFLMEKAGIPRTHPITRKCLELAEDLEGRQGTELIMQRNLSNRF